MGLMVAIADSARVSDRRSSDAELMAAVRRGDQAALGALYDGYASRVYSTALFILRDPARAEEVTQDVFLAAWNRGGSFDSQLGSVAGWLLRCARNRAIDLLRGSAGRAREEPEISPELAGETDVFQTVVRSIDSNLLKQAVAALPAGQRQVIELCYFGARSQVEAAAALGVPLSTVKGRSRLALRRLARLLDGVLADATGLDVASRCR